MCCGRWKLRLARRDETCKQDKNVQKHANSQSIQHKHTHIGLYLLCSKRHQKIMLINLMPAKGDKFATYFLAGGRLGRTAFFWMYFTEREKKTFNQWWFLPLPALTLYHVQALASRVPRIRRSNFKHNHFQSCFFSIKYFMQRNAEVARRQTLLCCRFNTNVPSYSYN